MSRWASKGLIQNGASFSMHLDWKIWIKTEVDTFHQKTYHIQLHLHVEWFEFLSNYLLPETSKFMVASNGQIPTSFHGPELCHQSRKSEIQILRGLETRKNLPKRNVSFFSFWPRNTCAWK